MSYDAYVCSEMGLVILLGALQKGQTAHAAGMGVGYQPIPKCRRFSPVVLIVIVLLCSGLLILAELS